MPIKYWYSWAFSAISVVAQFSAAPSNVDAEAKVGTRVREYYVSPWGSRWAAGDAEAPWTLEFALANKDRVLPGDTVWVKGGVYRGCFVSKLAGDSENPILVRAIAGNQAVIESDGNCAALTIEGRSTQVWGLYLRSQQFETPAVLVTAPDAKLIHLYVEKTGGIALSEDGENLEVYGSVFTQTKGRVDGTRLLNNIFWQQEGGMSAVGGASSNEIDFLVRNNTFIDSIDTFSKRLGKGRAHYRDNHGETAAATSRVNDSIYQIGYSQVTASHPRGAGEAIFSLEGHFDRGAEIEIRNARLPDGPPLFSGTYEGGVVRVPSDGSGDRSVYAVSSKADQPGKQPAVKSAVKSAVNAGAIALPLGPAGIPGLQLWLKADAGVTRSGTAVSRWGNQIGKATEASQSSAARQPQFQENAVNGKPAIRFDGINDRLRFTLPINGLNEMSIIAVSANLDKENGGYDGRENAVICWPETGGWGTVHLNPFASNVRLRFGTGQPNNLINYARPVDMGTSFSMTTAIKKGTVDTLFVNGQQVLAQSGKWSVIDETSSLGQLGEGAPSGQNFFGQIAEVLVFDRALTDGERLTVHQYLLSKYFQTSVNSAPKALDQTVAAQGTNPAPFLLTATDAENDPLIFTVVKQPLNGTLSGTAPALTYRAKTAANSTDSLLFNVSDGRGGVASGKVTFNIIAPPVPNVLPVARPSTLVLSGFVPITISFTGSASTDADGSIVSYIWDFGDDTSGSGAVVSHEYRSTGSKTVRLTVTDNRGGVAAATLLVTLLAAPVKPQSAPPENVIDIFPSANAQQIFNRYPGGTIYRLKTGVHRMQQIVPKAGDTIFGEPGAILNGSRILSSFDRENVYWVATGQTQQNELQGTCMPSAPKCNAAEDVFVDGLPLKQSASLKDVTKDSFFFDYNADKIYLGADPAGHIVEASVSTWAFDGTAANVTIRDLIVEKYANRAQYGAIHGVNGANWVVERVESRLNHGVGVKLGGGSKLLSSKVHHNGQMGVAAVGKAILIRGNEIYNNNTAGFDAGWEAGGSKFALTEDLTVSDNYVHHNTGPGLWTDIDNIRTTYENNLVEDNADAGIFHEISYDATIRNNTVQRNGTAFSPWLWGAQIQIAGSRNVEVTGNSVTVGTAGGHGIALIQQKRGNGKYGEWLTRNNWVHHNRITYESSAGMSGAVADYDKPGMTAGNNRFDFNIYKGSGTAQRWFWVDEMTWVQLRVTGQEANGEIQ